MLTNIINQTCEFINNSANVIMNMAGVKQQTKTKTVETIIFHNLLSVNINPTYISDNICKYLVFPTESLLSTTVSYDMLAELLNTYHHPTHDLDRWNDIASEHVELIKCAINRYPKEIQEILLSDILDLTYYFQYNLELWNITQLCIKYDVQPIDIFIAMVGDATPFGMGVFAYPITGTNGLTDIARADFQEQINASEKYLYREKYIHFDYWNGIGVKTSFPKDIQQHPMQVNIRRYNERNDDLGYCRIIKVFANRLIANLAEQQSDNTGLHVGPDLYLCP